MLQKGEVVGKLPTSIPLIDGQNPISPQSTAADDNHFRACLALKVALLPIVNAWPAFKGILRPEFNEE